MKSIYLLAQYERGDWLGERPITTRDFLELIKGQLEDGSFGRTDRLFIYKPGKLIARAKSKQFPCDLYRVRVYAPKRDLDTIRSNLRAEFGRIGAFDKPYLRKLGWNLL